MHRAKVQILISILNDTHNSIFIYIFAVKLKQLLIMKKIFSILSVAMCLLMAIPAQAQIKLGVKGGLNLANADFTGLNSNFKTENMTGFFVGPMLDINIPIIGLGLDGSLLYSERGTKFTSTSNDAVTNKQQSIDIPVNLKYSIGLGSLASIFLAAGPSFSFNIDSNNLTDDLLNLVNEDKSGSTPSIDRKKAEVSINIGGGVKLIKHLQLGINYNLPLSDSAKENFSEGDLAGSLGDIIKPGTFKTKTKMWQVSVAYIF